MEFRLNMDSENLNEIQDPLVSAEYLSKCFECSERTIFRYAKDEDLPRTPEGKYPLFKSLLWYLSKLKKNIEEISEDNPLMKEKITTQMLINKERFFKIKRMAGELVPVEMTDFVIGNVLTLVISRLVSLAYDINLSIHGDNKTLGKIQKNINEARNDIAAQMGKTNIDDLIKELYDENLNENENEEAENI